MNNVNYHVIQDGEIVDPMLVTMFSKNFDARDLVYTKQGYRCNFVGFVYSNEDVLISFPKNFFNSGEQSDRIYEKNYLESYIKILFKCIKKTSDIRNNKFSGIRDELNSIYPFLNFFEIQKYFMKYGLFTNQKEIKKYGYSGKISWKDTINKSPKLINSGNLLFLPLVIRDDREQHVFISKCMAFVIDSTLEKFSFFLEGNRVNLDTNDIDFSNTRLIISQLKTVRRLIFKDVHQKLVDHLIFFFEKKLNGDGQHHLKIYSFHLVWESMVKEYLQSKFLGIKENYAIEWSSNIEKNEFEKRVFHADVRGEDSYSIEPDYYLVSENKRYIFDAKYYQKLKELDYKQIAYYFLLKHHGIPSNQRGIIKEELETYNALILPTGSEEHREVHFELDTTYNRDETRFIIMAYYLNTFNLMRYFVRL